ncbi:hypothetical protein [Providencia sp. Me31A]|uniref:hypothetical protein n=1 Tax=Providencia sp. Me31A TaxID=3392637 RepID=UPI003D2A9434
MLIKPKKFNVNYIQYDTQTVYKDSIIRVITSKEIFFFYHSQFQNTDKFLTHLKSGEELIIAGHKLKNGGYWLHWVISDENNELKPNKIQEDSRDSIKYIIYSSIAIFFTFLMIIDGLNSPYIVILFLLSIFFCGFSIKNLIQTALSPLNASLIMYQEEKNLIINKGDFNYKAYIFIKNHGKKIALLINKLSFRVHNKFISESDFNIVIDDPERIGVHLDKFNVKSRETKNNLEITHVNTLKINKKTQIYNNLHLIGDGEKNYYCKTHNSYLSQFVITKFSHPFFIALGDKIEIISNIKDNQIIGLYNQKDNSAYLIKPKKHINYNEKTTPMIITSCVAIFILSYIPIFLFLYLLKVNYIALLLLIPTCLFVPLLILSLYLIKKSLYFSSNRLDKYLLVQNYLQYQLNRNNSHNKVNIILNNEKFLGFDTVIIDDTN